MIGVNMLDELPRPQALDPSAAAAATDDELHMAIDELTNKITHVHAGLA